MMSVLFYSEGQIFVKKRKILTFDFEEHNRGMPTSDNQVKKNEKSKKNRT